MTIPLGLINSPDAECSPRAPSRPSENPSRSQAGDEHSLEDHFCSPAPNPNKDSAITAPDTARTTSSIETSTPLTAQLNRMADRCGGLLNWHFAASRSDVTPRPHCSYSSPPTISGRGAFAGNTSPSEGRKARTTGLLCPAPTAPCPPPTTFPRFSQLPGHIQDNVLSQDLAAQSPRLLNMRLIGWKPSLPSVMLVSREMRRRAMMLDGTYIRFMNSRGNKNHVPGESSSPPPPKPVIRPSPANDDRQTDRTTSKE